MENVDVWMVVGLVLTVAAGLFGVFYGKLKTKLAQAVALLREAAEYGQAHLDAVSDNKYSEEEKALIAKEWADVVAAAKKFVKFKDV